MTLYRLYDAPSWPDVPFEHDGRGIFLRTVGDTPVGESGRVLEFCNRGFLKRKLAHQVHAALSQSEFRKLVLGASKGNIIGVFVDVTAALSAAGFASESPSIEALEAAILCSGTDDPGVIVGIADVLREWKPKAIFGQDLDWVLVLEAT